MADPIIYVCAVIMGGMILKAVLFQLACKRETASPEGSDGKSP